MRIIYPIFLLLIACESESEIFRFSVGEMVQSKLDKQCGMVIHRYDHGPGYRVRFTGISWETKSGLVSRSYEPEYYPTVYMKEFELERCEQ